MVVGKKADLVNKFLYILSYFIRCSEVLERSQQPYDFEDVDLDGLDMDSDKPFSDGTSQSSVLVGDSCSCVRSPVRGQDQSLQTTCTQCQANRIATSPDTGRQGSRSETPPMGFGGGIKQGRTSSPLVHADVVRVKLKGGSGSIGGGSRESVLGSEEEDPGGGRRVTAWIESPLNQFDSALVIDDHGLAVQEKQCNSSMRLGADPVPASGAALEVLIPNECVEQGANIDHIMEQTEKAEHESASQTALCRMSPTGVREEPDTVKIRHVGQASLLFVSPTISSGLLCHGDSPVKTPELDEQGATPTPLTSCDKNPDSAQSATLPDICDTDKDSLQGAKGSDTKCEYSHDSGMYDTLVPSSPLPTQRTPPDSLPCLQPRDSGLSVSSPPVSPHISTPTYQHSEEFHGMHEQKSLKKETLYRVPPNFLHSNSMFDEYFSEESEGKESLPPRDLPKRSKSDAERFKRMASIEGSSSLFDEYMSVPCPDTSHTSRISEVSQLSTIAPPDTSIFDEYFSCDQEVSLTLSLGSQKSEEPATLDHQRLHLADRRRATRPECLLMKSGKKEDERTTPRHRQTSGQSTATLTPARTR